MCCLKSRVFIALLLNSLVACRATQSPLPVMSTLPEKKQPSHHIVIDRKKERENFTNLLADINADSRLKQKEILVKEERISENAPSVLLLESPRINPLGVKRWQIENFNLATNTDTEEEVAELGCPDPKIGAVCDCVLIESALFAEQSAERALQVAEKSLLSQKTLKEWKGHGWDIEVVLASYNGLDDFSHIPTWSFTFHPKGKDEQKIFRVAVETKNFSVSSVGESKGDTGFP